LYIAMLIIKAQKNLNRFPLAAFMPSFKKKHGK